MSKPLVFFLNKQNGKAKLSEFDVFMGYDPYEVIFDRRARLLNKKRNFLSPRTILSREIIEFIDELEKSK